MTGGNICSSPDPSIGQYKEYTHAAIDQKKVRGSQSSVSWVPVLVSCQSSTTGVEWRERGRGRRSQYVSAKTGITSDWRYLVARAVGRPSPAHAGPCCTCFVFTLAIVTASSSSHCCSARAASDTITTSQPVASPCITHPHYASSCQQHTAHVLRPPAFLHRHQ